MHFNSFLRRDDRDGEGEVTEDMLQDAYENAVRTFRSVKLSGYILGKHHEPPEPIRRFLGIPPSPPPVTTEAESGAEVRQNPIIIQKKP